jgi:hypothetical protein
VRAINILEKRDEGHKDVIGGRKWSKYIICMCKDVITKPIILYNWHIKNLKRMTNGF